MPFIKARKGRIHMVRHVCRLTESNREVLALYARMIGDTPDYVLNQLIERCLLADRDFSDWREQQAHPRPDARTEPSATIKATPATR